MKILFRKIWLWGFAIISWVLFAVLVIPIATLCVIVLSLFGAMNGWGYWDTYQEIIYTIGVEDLYAVYDIKNTFLRFKSAINKRAES